MTMVPVRNPNLSSRYPDYNTRRLVVSESVFPNGFSLDAIRDYLRSQKVTGKLIVSISQGGTNSVVFEEKQSVNGATEIKIV
jgi:hypothetical protein